MTTVANTFQIAKGGEGQLSFNNYKTLDGHIENRISKVLDGSIITLFDKTPVPQSDNDVVCPHFLELKWANGCKFNCAWCFLQGTYRFHPEWKNGEPNIKDYKVIEQHIKKFIELNTTNQEILNSGELADSLLNENCDYPFSQFIVDVLDKYDKEKKYRILFLTKSNQVNNIVKMKRSDRIVMAFSLNADAVAKKWEKAPSIKQRIAAAKKVFDAGYDTRVRIDPMVPIEDWEMHYFKLVDDIFANFIPERITIGSLRGLQATINNSKDRTWVDYLSEKSNWGKKIDVSTRYKMYSTIIGYISKEYNYDNVALCKETVELWDKLKLDYSKIRCNCML